MNQSVFHETVRLLEADGQVVTASRYDKAAFGSWFVEVQADPPLRVVWDGKDGWLIVQTGEQTGGWADWWVGKEESQHSAETAARKVVECIRREGA